MRKESCVLWQSRQCSDCTASTSACARAEAVHDAHSHAAGAGSGGAAAGQARTLSDEWARVGHSSIPPQHLLLGSDADQQPHQSPGPMPSRKADPVVYPGQAALSMARRMSQPGGTCALGGVTPQGQELEVPTSAANPMTPAPAAHTTLRLRGCTSADEAAVTLAADDRTRTLERAMDRAMLFWSAGSPELASREGHASPRAHQP